MTDERDPRVSERYRQLPGEEPPRKLDQAVLAAAHRAADKPHAPLVVPAGRHRWYYSLAAAAILVLADAVTVQVERQQPDPELAVPTSPVQAPSPAAQPEKPKPPPQPAASSKPQPRVLQERARAYTPDPPARAPAAAPEMQPRPEPAPSAGAMADSAQLRKERAAGDVAASRAAPSPRASATISAQSSMAVMSPERELERIAELRSQGRHDEADKALAEFRKRYPDYQIPQAMREKVEIRPAR